MKMNDDQIRTLKMRFITLLASVPIQNWTEDDANLLTAIGKDRETDIEAAVEAASMAIDGRMTKPLKTPPPPRIVNPGLKAVT